MTAYAPDLLRDERHHAARAYPDFRSWLEHLGLEDKADRTLDDYERTGAALLRDHLEHELAAYTPAELTRFLAGQPKSRQRVVYAHVNSLFRWALLLGLVERNPMERVPRPRGQRQRVVDVFSPMEMELLRELPTPDGQLMTILLDTGIRKAEARNLRLVHVSLDRREVKVLGKGSKERVVPLTERAYNAVRELIVLEGLDRGDYLWYSRPGGHSVIARAKPIVPASFHLWWKRCLDRAGVEYRNPHTTRHTFATTLLRNGARLSTVKTYLGHASIKTTEDIYAHLTTDDVRAEIGLLEVSP